MREFYIHNALYWLEEYRFDGLRFDAVHAIFDRSELHFMVELARRVRREVPREVHLIIENERNRAALLRQDPILGRRLFEAQWNDDLYHPATFARSRLDWSEPAQPAHAAWLASTRELLRLRAAKIAPLLVEAELAVVRSEPLGTRGLRMSWRLAGGRSLDLLANLGPDPVAAPTPAGEPLYVTHPGWSDAMPPWSVDWSLSQHE